MKTTIGMDISDKKSEICAIDRKGNVLERRQVVNSLTGLAEGFSNFEASAQTLVAMEAGTHSPWISRALSDMGFSVLVGNSRKLRSIWHTDRKSDRRDAEMLARIARFDCRLFYPIKHRSKKSQATLAVLKARDALVQSRKQLISSVRGMLKSMGIVLKRSSADAFARNALAQMPEDYTFALADTIDLISTLSDKIKVYDRKIAVVAERDYPETQRLTAIKGVGPISSLTYVLTLEHPHHFRKSRDVGPYLGLVPKLDQSGDSSKELNISKAGNAFLRRLLVQNAQYILGPFGEDSDLRRYGERIASRGGAAAKKKAVVAVARKLSCVLHRLWRDEAIYDPFYNACKRGQALEEAV
jgi:transposase